MTQCGSPLAPFGALSGAACTGAPVASGAQCDVACYAGFTGGGTATCTGGTLAFSMCVPEQSHRTIVLKGLPDSELGLNGTYEAEPPYTTVLKWKSKSGGVIEAELHEPDKLGIWMGSYFKGAIKVKHSGGTTTLTVVSITGDEYPGSSATFGPDAKAETISMPVAATCAALRTCLALTPLDLAACASGATACAAAAAPTSLVAAGSTLDHKGTKVVLYTLERALFGTDSRGVFVVLADTGVTKTTRGKMLFVAAGASKGALVDVLFDEQTKVWRAKTTNWVLIVALIGGGVVLFLLLVLAIAHAFREDPVQTYFF
jgi:hypothetical protein